MIVAHALDFPKIEPDNWDIFWDMWNKHAKSLVKVKYDITNRYKSDAPAGATDYWIGLDLYRNNFFSHWQAPLVDVSTVLPNMYNNLLALELPNIRLIRIVRSLISLGAHSDTGADSWQVRAMLHCDNPSEHWYYTPYGVKNKESSLPLKLPKETNWFTYNDANCHHGTEYFPDSPKYLLQVFYEGKMSDITHIKGIDKYPDCVIQF